MKILLFLSFLLSLVNAQDIVWEHNVSLNSYGWLPYDYFEGQLFYYSDGFEYNCSISPPWECSVKKPDYEANTYVIKNNSLYVNDLLGNRTCRYSQDGTKFCFNNINNNNSTKEYLRRFKSIAVTSHSLYITEAEGNTTYFYNLNSLNETKDKPTYIITNESPILVEDDGLYSIKSSSKSTLNITKNSPDGSRFEWETLLPNCKTRTPTTDVLILSAENKIYVLCKPMNLVSIYTRESGIIINQFPIEGGNVMAFACSLKFLFILYNTGIIAQYALNFDYVHTYAVVSMKTPNYNILRVDQKYMFYVLCSKNGNDSGCINPTLYQRKIMDVEVSAEVSYKYQVSSVNYELSMNFETYSDLKTKIVFSKSLKNIENWENSYLSPVSYKDRNNEYHLIYFSGGGIMSKGLCGDIFLHDIVVTELVKTNGTTKNLASYSEQYVLSGSPSYPISDSASFLISIEDKSFYIIHGGISCDYLQVFSTIYAVDLVSLIYSVIPQRNGIE
jgi:hypothetical protein